jgi:hypothetical protein
VGVSPLTTRLSSAENCSAKSTVAVAFSATRAVFWTVVKPFIDACTV